MAGLCEGGNEPPGSLKASNREFYYHHFDCLLFGTARYGLVTSGQRVTSTIDIALLWLEHISKDESFLERYPQEELVVPRSGSCRPP
ncbi:hypothetical protein ANN_12693 [Periplaneta americana]|uniref:Uncharacterized protein n=1 Tax=Periplaneta americana TaxID=6978 RepID=A0ABQ8THW2_PERAM|nr:hypothetical protein ANN_12693 [Periplaneta americana]